MSYIYNFEIHEALVKNGPRQAHDIIVGLRLGLEELGMMAYNHDDPVYMGLRQAEAYLHTRREVVRGA